MKETTLEITANLQGLQGAVRHLFRNEQNDGAGVSKTGQEKKAFLYKLERRSQKKFTMCDTAMNFMLWGPPEFLQESPFVQILRSVFR